MPHSYHLEKHYLERAGWLRAAVLGANDGILFQSPVWWSGWQPAGLRVKCFW